MNPSQESTPAQLPVGAKMVAWLLVVGGALFAVVGTIGVFDPDRAEALMGVLMLAFGVAYLVVGAGCCAPVGRPTWSQSACSARR